MNILCLQFICFWFSGIVKFTWPFAILTVLIVTGTVLLILERDLPRKPRPLTLILIAHATVHGLLYWAGFYDIFLNN